VLLIVAVFEYRGDEVDRYGEVETMIGPRSAASLLMLNVLFAVFGEPKV